METRAKFDDALLQVWRVFLALVVIPSLALTVLAFVYHTTSSTCSARAVLTLQQFLLGFAIANLVFVGYLMVFLWCTCIRWGLAAQVMAGLVFLVFFVVFHFSVYDGLFVRGTCLSDQPAMWFVTLAIVALQVVAFVASCFVMFAFHRLSVTIEVSRALDDIITAA